LVRRPDLAETLQRIADHGRDGFYTGETATRLIAGLGQNALMSVEDLATYRAIERKPLSVDYRGLTVETMPPPSAGGPALVMILSQLSALSAWKNPRGSALDLHLFLEASRRAQADRRFSVVDPARLSAAALAERTARWTDGAALLAKHPIDPEHATPSPDVNPLFAAAMRELEHTTHLSVVDAEGNAVSLTTTLSAGFGAKIMPKGTGVVLNNSVASFGTAGDNLPKAGARTVSSMAPTLLSSRGKLVAVLGSPGGDTIPSTVAQVLRNLVDAGMTLDDAVDAPRVHHGFAPDEMRYERRRPPPKSVLDELVRRGHHLSKKRIPMGDANDIVIADDVAYGYADPREGGLAAAAKK
jgi:gamma-glutamyltranspeptidase/glutathione hydrolase